MKERNAIVVVVALVTVLIGPPARGAMKVTGEVVQVEQQVRTQNGGIYDVATVRTRQGEQVQLRLGPAGSCNGCVQQGDQIRARIGSGGGNGDAAQIRNMKVRRNGEMYSYGVRSGRLSKTHGGSGSGARGVAGSGDMLQDRDRDRLRDGSCTTCESQRSGQRGGGSRGGGR